MILIEQIIELLHYFEEKKYSLFINASFIHSCKHNLKQFKGHKNSL